MFSDNGTELDSREDSKHARRSGEINEGGFLVAAAQKRKLSSETNREAVAHNAFMPTADRGLHRRARYRIPRAQPRLS